MNNNSQISSLLVRKSKTLSLPSYGKLNLFLDILHQKKNGYHSLLSVATPINLQDTLTLEPFESTNKIGTITFPQHPELNESNSLSQTIKMFYARYPNRKNSHVRFNITVNKIIPPGSGLGAGTSNAVTLLKFLLQFHDLNNTIASKPNEIQYFMQNIGCDASFFFHGVPSLISGIGHDIQTIPKTSRTHFVVCIPPQLVSTKVMYEQFSKYSKHCFASEKTYQSLIQGFVSGNWKQMATNMFNIFEHLPNFHDLQPTYASIKYKLLQSGALQAMLSGTGSCIFGLFPSEQSAYKATTYLQKQNIFGSNIIHAISLNAIPPF